MTTKMYDRVRNMSFQTIQWVSNKLPAQLSIFGRENKMHTIKSPSCEYPEQILAVTLLDSLLDG